MLFQLVGDLVEPGLGAGLVLVAAGRARHADRADDVIADLDRQPAGGSADIAEPQRETGRVFLLPLPELAGRRAKRPRRIGLAKAVLDRVRRALPLSSFCVSSADSGKVLIHSAPGGFSMNG